MNPATRWRSFALLSVAALLASVALADEGEALEPRVDAIVQPLVEAHEFSGAIVLLRQGKPVYQRGFGMANHEERMAFTPDTASDGGSLAKTFTAAGLQWLAHEGKVELDALVTRYLPRFPHPQTTLRQLISHSNGLPPYYEFFDPFFEPTEVRATEAMIEIIAREQPTPAFTPGTRFEYSNFAFDIAALVIEKVTGQGYEEFLRERFFSPLAMDSSFARPARLTDWKGVRTLGYRWSGNDWKFVDVFDMEGFLGASNLYFSAADLGRWASANAAGTALPSVVFATGQQRVLIDGRPSSITGLSWYCSEDGLRCYYTGDINAFHGFVYWDRERDEAAVFLSNSSLSPWPLITLQRALVDMLAGRQVTAEETSRFLPLKKNTRAALSGSYRSDTLGAMEIAAGASGLRLRIGEGLWFDAFPVGPTVLYVPGPDYWLAFSGDESAVSMHLRSMFVDTVARRAKQKPRPDAAAGQSVTP